MAEDIQDRSCTPEFEEKKAAKLQVLAESIPDELYLPQEITDNPPTDVSELPRTCGILTPEELEITENYDAAGLAEAIAAREYTAVAVAKAFSKRAAIAHQLTCCLTEFFMERAIKQAKQLDEYLISNGETIGPLHGVPISIKEHMPIAGTYSSQGYFSSIVKDEKDSQMVKILRAAGAVF
ncbi:hypothetical protein A1O1_06048 [Capronia coronata CBS 617.96]|uniref:Amidase domain-containing protein n=1 Tax=Capronia coronata CBS 617.96 TaxID=1182541 RepID=W9XYP7_9EURO|nr:uncharacterized protein A1O1_06048 [Capronia coronata CBS 617.96]EXJ85682.1 hypothetical protein A1O1_06048 [Capronia coronata CBS 617.96]